MKRHLAEEPERMIQTFRLLIALTLASAPIYQRIAARASGVRAAKDNRIDASEYFENAHQLELIHPLDTQKYLDPCLCLCSGGIRFFLFAAARKARQHVREDA